MLYMVKYLLDSSAVIDILRKNIPVKQNMNEALRCKNELAICPHVYYEVVRGFKILDGTKKLKAFLALAESLEVLPFDFVAADKAVEIYLQLHKGQTIEDNDIYIAATAIVNNCVLVTANTRHFGRIEGLEFVNWRL